MNPDGYSGGKPAIDEQPPIDDCQFQPESKLLKQIRTHLIELRFKRSSLLDLIVPTETDPIDPSVNSAHPEKDRVWWNTKRNIFVVGFLGIPVLVSLVVLLSGMEYLSVVIIIAGVSVLIARQSWLKLNALWGRTEDKLPRSNLLQQIAANELSIYSISEHVAKPFATLYIGGRPGKLEQVLTLIAYNLDWYLDEPKNLLRINWISETVGVPLSLVMIISAFNTALAGSQWWLPLVPGITIPLLLLSVYPSLYAVRKREILLEAFIRYVGAQLKD